MNSVSNSIFLIFIIYSFFGWIVEALYVGLITEKKFYNRGFLYLPIIPLYGFGALLIISSVYNLQTNILLKLIIIIILTTFLEYLTALIMENLFQIKWWDYSKHKYNFKGRVCLRNSILFGIGGLFILLIHPYIQNFINKVNTPMLTFLEVIILIAITIDIYITLKKLTKIEARDIRYFSQGKVLLPQYEYDIKHIRELFVKKLIEAIFLINIVTLTILIMITKDIVYSLAMTIIIIGVTYIIIYGYIKKRREKQEKDNKD